MESGVHTIPLRRLSTLSFHCCETVSRLVNGLRSSWLASMLGKGDRVIVEVTARAQFPEPAPQLSVGNNTKISTCLGDACKSKMRRMWKSTQ